MNKHLSVFAFYIRAVFAPALILILLTAAVTGTLLYTGIAEEIRMTEPGSLHGVEVLGLEYILSHSAIPQITAGTLVLLTILLILPGAAFGSQTLYTTARLRIGEKTVFLWHAAFGALLFLLFWAAEACALYAVCLRYTAVGTATEQS